MISLIIPSYQNPEYLEFCLSAAYNHQDRINEIIAVIDGPGTPEQCIQYQNLKQKWSDKLGVRIIVLTENMGLPYATNTGVQQSTTGLVLVINEDNVLPHGWDTISEKVLRPGMTISFMQVEPDPSIFHFYHQDFGKNPKEFNMNEYLQWEGVHRNDKETGAGCLLPFLIQKLDYMKVGGWDTAFSSPFVVDLDFWLKLQLTGMDFRTSNSMIVYHFGSRSTKKTGIESDIEHWAKNEQLGMAQFYSKWGIYPSRTSDYRINMSNLRGVV